MHFYLAPPANLRNSQSVFLMIYRRRLSAVFRRVRAAARIVGVFVIVVAVCVRTAACIVAVVHIVCVVRFVFVVIVVVIIVHNLNTILSQIECAEKNFLYKYFLRKNEADVTSSLETQSQKWYIIIRWKCAEEVLMCRGEPDDCKSTD